MTLPGPSTRHSSSTPARNKHKTHVKRKAKHQNKCVYVIHKYQLTPDTYVNTLYTQRSLLMRFLLFFLHGQICNCKHTGTRVLHKVFLQTSQSFQLIEFPSRHCADTSRWTGSCTPLTAGRIPPQELHDLEQSYIHIYFKIQHLNSQYLERAKKTSLKNHIAMNLHSQSL